MNIEWTREPAKKGWYIWAPLNRHFSEVKVMYIDPDNLPQSEGEALMNGSDWYLGPIHGYPTENFGILEQ
jgi:hypothetical protein